MPDENEEKKNKEKKQEVTTEVTIGVINDTPVAYSTGKSNIYTIDAASDEENVHQHDAYDSPCVFIDYDVDENGNTIAIGTQYPFDLEMPEFSYNETVHCQYKYDYQNLFDINIQREQKADVNTICSNMKNFINENKDTNPELVKIAIATLQTMSYLYYDEGTNNIIQASGFTRKDLGNTSEEILEKIYNTAEGEMLEGFVCSTISDFTMRLLHECNIEAVMLCGGKNGSDHTTLLYKQEEGKYVYVDNGLFTTVSSSNIKDAVKALHRQNTSPGDFGYIMLIDENNSYQEFDSQDETIWGHELDKRDYNKTFAKVPVIEGSTSINADYNMSLTGGNEINLTGTFVKNKDDNTVIQHKISLGYKNNNFFMLGDDINPGTYLYNSTGIKHERDRITQNDNGNISYSRCKTILNTTGISYPLHRTINYNDFNIVYHEYDQDSLNAAQIILDEAFENQLQNIPEEMQAETYQRYFNLKNMEDYCETGSKMTHIGSGNFRNFMLFNRYERGIQTKINDNLSTTGQLSSTIGLNARPFDGIVFCGDLRLAAEESLNYSQQYGATEIKADINGGILADMSIKTGVLKPGIGLGAKGNADLSIMTHLTDNLSVGANTSGYVVSTPVSTDYGATAGIGVAYNKDNVSIFGNLNTAIDKQRLYIGQLDEMTENSTLLNALIGVRVNKNTFQAGYTAQKDALNPTKNKNIFTLSVNFNF